MLQNIRKNAQGTAAKIIVGLIVVSFAIFGVESILVGGSGGGVAEVNGEEIGAGELQQAVVFQQRRLMAMMGDDLDPALLDESRLRGPALETLISRRLLTQAALNRDLAVSEGEIGATVGSIEAFQVSGTFSPDLYKRVLGEQGYTPAQFKRTLRDDILANQLLTGLAGSEFATPAELALNARIAGEQRDFRYLTIPGDTFRAPEEVDETAIQAYYEEHRESFLSPESVDVSYIELTLDDFRAPVEEEAVLAAFEQARQGAGMGTENRVSHILFEGDDEEVAQRVAAARSRLEAGEDFAAVAADLSDDPGSAGRGGDLGYSSGGAFPEEMERAIAELQTGEVSEPVRTDAGVHLILLTERREGREPTLEDMRPQLEESIQVEAARLALLRTVESLRDLSFNANDLEGPAEELGLDVQRADGITRAGEEEGLFANAALRDAAFSAEVLEAGHNSEVIELAGERFAVLRVRRHHEPEIRPLEDVRQGIVDTIADARAREAVVDAADSVIERLRSGTPMDEIASEAGYQWQVELAVDRNNFTVPRDVLGRVFELPRPEGDEPVREHVMTPAGDAVVVELVRVRPGAYDSMPDAEREQLARQVENEFGGLVNTEFRQRLRRDADIVVM